LQYVNLTQPAFDGLAVVPDVFQPLGMPDADKLTPANPSDLANTIAFALRFEGRKRVHNGDEIIA